jgi:hypothetical protein
MCPRRESYIMHHGSLWIMESCTRRYKSCRAVSAARESEHESDYLIVLNRRKQKKTKRKPRENQRKPRENQRKPKENREARAFLSTPSAFFVECAPNA